MRIRSLTAAAALLALPASMVLASPSPLPEVVEAPDPDDEAPGNSDQDGDGEPGKSGQAPGKDKDAQDPEPDPDDPTHEDPDPDPEDPEPEPVDSRVVVAPVDSGINPYHDFFQVPQSQVTEAVLDEFRAALEDGQELRTVELGESYDDDLAAGVYDWVDEGDVAFFAGTNIVARAGSGIADDGRPFLPDDAGDTHGTGVTGSVVRGNPEAIVFFVEFGNAGTANEAVAFAHPAVDIVTTSYGLPTAAPLPLDGSYSGVVELGKLHAGATTNDPSLAAVDGTGGPWWVLGVAGFEEDTGEETVDDDGLATGVDTGSEGKQVLSGSIPDVVADFTQTLPYCDVCTTATRTVGGTSFATPYTAGIASAVLLDARRDADHVGGIVTNEAGEPVMVDRADGDDVTTWDLRRALEVGAYVPTELDPTSLAETSLPVNPLLPAAQVGWGAITAAPEHGVVEAAMAYLADGTLTGKPAGTCEFMTGVITARFLTWDLYPTSDSLGQTNALGGSPYVTC